MMSNEKLHNNQIGLRIRTARKEKGINQTELANLLGKSLRTIQKYESGEIEVSIAMLNEIAKVLDCESTYLIGYDAERKPLENLSDIMNFLFQLDKIKELGFNIEVKRPPHYDGWECAITFNGKDVSTELNRISVYSWKNLRIKEMKSRTIRQVLNLIRSGRIKHLLITQMQN